MLDYHLGVCSSNVWRATGTLCICWAIYLKPLDLAPETFQTLQLLQGKIREPSGCGYILFLGSDYPKGARIFLFSIIEWPQNVIFYSFRSPPGPAHMLNHSPGVPGSNLYRAFQAPRAPGTPDYLYFLLLKDPKMLSIIFLRSPGARAHIEPLAGGPQI